MTTSSEYCSVCEQDQTSGFHVELCPGKIVRNCNGLTFREWKALVNHEIHSIAEVTSDDLQDMPYWDSWDAGMTPKEAAYEALEMAGFPFDN